MEREEKEDNGGEEGDASRERVLDVSPSVSAGGRFMPHRPKSEGERKGWKERWERRQFYNDMRLGTMSGVCVCVCILGPSLLM